MKYTYYQIRNTITNEKYIGITTDTKERRYRHFYELSMNKHDNPKLQAAFNKYGHEAFIWEVLLIKEYDNKEEAYQQEYLLIKENNSVDEGYNIALGGKYTAFHSQEVHDKITEINQNKVPNIVQITMDTLQKVAVYPSLRAAARAVNTGHGNISDACNKTHVSSCGYYWAYEHEYNSGKWKPPISHKNKPIGRVDENGTLIAVYSSAAEAARLLNIDRSNIRSSIQRNGTCNGYKFILISREEYYNF